MCRADLVLTGRVQHVPAEDSHPTLNVVNRTTQVELVLDLVNRGETAFGMQLTVNISGQVGAQILCFPLKTEYGCLYGGIIKSKHVHVTFHLNTV